MPDRSKPLANSLPTRANRETEEFLSLQDEWYQRLADEGFQDVERHAHKKRDEKTGRLKKTGHVSGDLVSGYTEREIVSVDATEIDPDDPNAPADNQALQENLEVFGQPTTVWDTPTAQRWRFYSQEVAALPPNYPHRAFLVRWAELGGDVVNAAKDTRISRWHGREAVRKFKSRLRKQGRLR